MTLLGLLLIFVYSIYTYPGMVAFNTSCDVDKCYMGVMKSHTNLQDNVKKLAKINVNFPSDANDSNITSLINRNEQVGLSIADIHKNLVSMVDKLHKHIEDSRNDRNILDNVSLNLATIGDNAELNGIINEFRENLEFVEHAVNNKYAALEACNTAIRLYEETLHFLTTVLNQGKEIIDAQIKAKERTVSINEEISNILSVVIQNRKDVDLLKIPDDYLQVNLNSRAEEIKHLINLLSKNKNDLKDLINNLLIDKTGSKDAIKEINTKLSQTEEDLESINRSLDSYELLIPTITENITFHDFLQLIKTLATEMNDLEQSIKSMAEDLAKIKSDLLRGKEVVKLIEQRRTELIEEIYRLKEYVLLTHLLLISEKREFEIKEQIYLARKTMELIKQRRELQSEFDDVKRIYDEILSYKKEEICLPDVQLEN